MPIASTRTVELDLRGQVCPAALFLALKSLGEHHAGLASGECEIAIRTDNRDSVPTISEAARNMGYAVTVEHPDGHYLLRVAVPEAGEEGRT
ncbi:MAG: sulfurtransferase TusA family protein [Deltaproteobacteria bacterium]|nr:sulfurtransferase TusA family protein [Deltaproteobacteria bacterium]